MDLKEGPHDQPIFTFLQFIYLNFFLIQKLKKKKEMRVMPADSKNPCPPRSLPFSCTFQYEYKIRVFKIARNFPGGPVAKTPCSQYRGLGFGP